MRPVEEIACRDGALAAGRADVHLRVERHDRGRQLRPRGGVGERAAHRPPVTRREIPGMTAGCTEERLRAGGDVIVDERLLAGQRADPELAVALLDAPEACHAVDVHQDGGLQDAELHQRHEALAAREHARIVAAREQVEHLVDRLGRVVDEAGRLHQTAVVASGSGGFALSRYSIVVNTSSASPVFSRSWIIDSPAANDRRRVSPGAYVTGTVEPSPPAPRGAQRPTRRRAARRPSRSRGRRYTTSSHGLTQRRLRAARLNVRAAARTRPSTRPARGSVDPHRAFEVASPATAGRATIRSRGVRAWRPGSSHRVSVPRATARRAPPTGRGASCFR